MCLKQGCRATVVFRDTLENLSESNVPLETCFYERRLEATVGVSRVMFDAASAAPGGAFQPSIPGSGKFTGRSLRFPTVFPADEGKRGEVK